MFQRLAPVLFLTACGGGADGLAGQWGGTCDLGFGTWGLGLDLSETDAFTIGEGGAWEVVSGTAAIDSGSGPLDFGVVGGRCLADGCVNFGVEERVGWLTLQTDLGDGTTLVLESEGIQGDRLDGLCSWNSGGAYALGFGDVALVRDAAPGDPSGAPTTGTSPDCPAPTGSCDADPGTCEVDHFTDDAHCGVCGATCSGCDEGRCDTSLPPMTMSSAWETCAVVGADLVCWPLQAPESAAIVRSGDVVGVAMGDAVRCVLTTVGDVSCGPYGGGTASLVGIDGSWTGAVEIAVAQNELCALYAGGRVRCHRFDDGTEREPVATGALRVVGSRGGFPTWQLAGGEVRSRLITAPSADPDGSWTLVGLPLVDVAYGQYGKWGIRTDSTVYTNTGSDGGIDGAVRVAAGWNQAAVLLGDGTVHAFGEIAGPLGAVPGVSGAVAVVAGYTESCALRAGPAVTCWDANLPGTTWEVPLPAGAP